MRYIGATGGARPLMEFDHIAVAGMTLGDAQDHVEQRLGVALQPGGRHDVFATHNALLGLEKGLYLEAIAADPAAPAPERARWFDLDRFSGAPRLTNWICRTDDIEALCAAFPGAGAPVALSRGDLRWRMAVPDDGRLPFDNLFPAIIQWDVPEEQRPPASLETQPVQLDRLTISHPEAADLAQALGPVLDDKRIAFETGPAGLRAALTTPDGLVEL
jgi:hypothetical protein